MPNLADHYLLDAGVAENVIVPPGGQQTFRAFVFLLDGVQRCAVERA